MLAVQVSISLMEKLRKVKALVIMLNGLKPSVCLSSLILIYNPGYFSCPRAMLYAGRDAAAGNVSISELPEEDQRTILQGVNFVKKITRGLSGARQ